MTLAPAPSRETIVGVATPIGEGALAVVRISGPDALRIARALAPGLPSGLQPRVATLARIESNRGALIDRSLVLWFKAPASFTGEDTVEIQCHGGVETVRAIVAGASEQGARLAEPGEFSRRAFLNGKLDLTQVEAIADVIKARGEAAHALAQAQLDGAIGRALAGPRAALVDLLVLVEAAIDFSTEEHVYSLAPTEVARRLTQPLAALNALLGTHESGRLRHDGVRVAIVGAPNAGKSSLLNHLLQWERAIVTEVPGTTRDTIEESVVIEGVCYRLVDTAGLRETDDRVEQLGIARTRAALAAADVTLVVVDSAASGQIPHEVGDAVTTAVWGVVWNKRDVASGDPRGQLPGRPECWVSLANGQDTEALRPLLQALARDAGLRGDEDSVLITRERHREALRDAVESLERARQAGVEGFEHEFIALDLRLGLDALGRLTGAITSDDVLNRIFEGFCIGK